MRTSVSSHGEIWAARRSAVRPRKRAQKPRSECCIQGSRYRVVQNVRWAYLVHVPKICGVVLHVFMRASITLESTSTVEALSRGSV